MKILFVWPSGYHDSVLPIVFAYLVNQVDKTQHQVELIDCVLYDLLPNSLEFKNKLRDFNPDIVGLSCWSPVLVEALETAQTIKEVCPHTKLVFGGVHANLSPDNLMIRNEIDFLLRGECDFSFRKFLEEFSNQTYNWKTVPGLAYKNAENRNMYNPIERIETLDDLPIPDYKFIELDKYIAKGYRLKTSRKFNAPIWVTRGCPHVCGYCSAPLQSGHMHRSHSIEYVLKWMKYLYDEFDIRYFNIIDDNFTHNMDFAKDLCRAIIALKLDITMATPRGICLERSDLELFQLMKKAGWQEVVFAPESGSDKVLVAMKKGTRAAWLLPKVMDAKKAKLKIHLFYMIGYPGETVADLEETIRSLRTSNPDLFTFNLYAPLPGTPSEAKLLESGELNAQIIVPRNFHEGERVYVTKGIQEVNIWKLIVREYFLLYLKNPLKIMHMIEMFGPVFLFSQGQRYIKNLVLSLKPH